MKNIPFKKVSGIFSLLLFVLLFLMTSCEGDSKALKYSYTIEIINCSSIGNSSDDIDLELKAILLPTENKIANNGSFFSPTLKVKDKPEFDIPIAGMNSIRNGISQDMFLYKDRQLEVEAFFKNKSKSNLAFQEIKKIVSKGDSIDDYIIDSLNVLTEFIIQRNYTSNDPQKKIWKSLAQLRPHLDSLLNEGKITAGSTVKIYYFCGEGNLDDDGDGVKNSIDKCPTQAGTIAMSGCPDSDKDGIHDGEDQCKDKAGDKACFGCPCPPPPLCPGDADDDKDGVCNKYDKCPNLFGNYLGCPDNDKDGILNADDKCPNEAGDIACFGCPCPPLDTDGDGIIDKDDKCPNEYGKSPDGCPIKVNIVHDNKNGYFEITGVKINNQTTAKLKIKQRNGKIIDLNFETNKYPANDDQSKQILGFISEGGNMEIEIIVLDSEGKELKREKFNEISYVCFSQTKCGFAKIK